MTYAEVPFVVIFALVGTSKKEIFCLGKTSDVARLHAVVVSQMEVMDGLAVGTLVDAASAHMSLFVDAFRSEVISATRLSNIENTLLGHDNDRIAAFRYTSTPGHSASLKDF